MSKYTEIDLNRIHTHSIHDRKRKVDVSRMAHPIKKGDTCLSFIESLPDILASRDLKALVEKIVQAKQSGKPVLIMMGAHVIKVGLSPIVIDLMENGVVQGIAMNGAGAIHDMELAYFGITSEDVSSSLMDGSFGMARETAELLNQTIRGGNANNALGFGEAMGRRIAGDQPDHYRFSILCHAYQMDIPVTVHVAVGTDIVHQHPSADGAAIGEASLRDFRIWTDLASQIGNGGVILLFGSSVILPEVFLKSLTVARNIAGPITNFTTANFDMIRHYRPRLNVVERPTRDGGVGFNFIGHHEIMIPLLAAAIREKL